MPICLHVLSFLSDRPVRMLKNTWQSSWFYRAGNQDPLHHLQDPVQSKNAGPRLVYSQKQKTVEATQGSTGR